MALVSLETVTTTTLVSSHALSPARTYLTVHIGRDTMAVSDGTVDLHKAIVTLTVIRCNASAMSRANRCMIGGHDTKATWNRAIGTGPSLVALASIFGSASTVTRADMSGIVTSNTKALDRDHLSDATTKVTSEDTTTVVSGRGNSLW